MVVVGMGVNLNDGLQSRCFKYLTAVVLARWKSISTSHQLQRSGVHDAYRSAALGALAPTSSRVCW